jgi:hypothetical protein
MFDVFGLTILDALGSIFLVAILAPLLVGTLVGIAFVIVAVTGRVIEDARPVQVWKLKAA